MFIIDFLMLDYFYNEKKYFSYLSVLLKHVLGKAIIDENHEYRKDKTFKIRLGV